MLEQQMIELRADHLETVRVAQLTEIELPRISSPGEVPTVLAHEAVRFELISHADEIADLQDRGEERLANVIAGKDLPFQECYIDPFTGQERCSGRSSRSSADHQDLC